jgi:predicted Zn-dependent protease
MSTPASPATRFDGRRAEATPVSVRVEDGHLVVEANDGAVVDHVLVSRAIISDPFEHAPRMVWLPIGATLEVPDADRHFARELERAGMRLPLAVRLQRWWPAVLTGLAAMVAGLAVLYVVALPAVAHWVAFALPPSLEARMGQQVLAVLDRHYLKPSRLEVGRREAIADRLARAAAATAPGVPYRLEFRRAGTETVNAMALPGGTIVLLDGLVDFAGDDNAVLGVLGHELGHVVHKHSARQIVTSLGVGTVASLLWGDFSGVAASVPVVLGMLRYSRSAEREADEFAITLLRTQSASVRSLVEFFERLGALESPIGDEKIPDFLSTHPATEERLERLRREIR